MNECLICKSDFQDSRVVILNFPSDSMSFHPKCFSFLYEAFKHSSKGVTKSISETFTKEIKLYPEAYRLMLKTEELYELVMEDIRKIFSYLTVEGINELKKKTLNCKTTGIKVAQMSCINCDKENKDCPSFKIEVLLE